MLALLKHKDALTDFDHIFTFKCGDSPDGTDPFKFVFPGIRITLHTDIDRKLLSCTEHYERIVVKSMEEIPTLGSDEYLFTNPVGEALLKDFPSDKIFSSTHPKFEDKIFRLELEPFKALISFSVDYISVIDPSKLNNHYVVRWKNEMIAKRGVVYEYAIEDYVCIKAHI